ncbi:MAG TPA: hypothetical protein VN513_06255 [Gemmatimonadales bacterium]|nr:hypothetical protein [Gemmatimonadales bacterium]
MADTLVLTGCVTDQRKLKVRMRREVSQQLARWKPGTELTVTIERKRATRSLLANSLYWVGYVKPFSDYTGYPPDACHEFFKRKFLPTQRFLVQDGDGVVLDEMEIAPTTTTLNNVEFSEYLMRITDWTADTFHGAVIVGSNQEAA